MSHVVSINLFHDVIDADLLAASLFKRLFSLFLSLHHAQSTLSDRQPVYPTNPP